MSLSHPTPRELDTAAKPLWDAYASSRSVADRNKLIEHYLPVYKWFIERLHKRMNLPSSIETDDVFSWGITGLMDAVERFDPAKGLTFWTYCQHRIRGAVLDQVREFDWVPRITRQRSRKLDAAIRHLTNSLGRPPSEEELAIHLSETHGRAARFIRSRGVPTEMIHASLNGAKRYDDFTSVEYALEPSTEDRGLEQVDVNDALDHCEMLLFGREREAFQLRRHKDLPMRELGKFMRPWSGKQEGFGVSESFVSVTIAAMHTTLQSQRDHILEGAAV